MRFTDTGLDGERDVYVCSYDNDDATSDVYITSDQSKDRILSEMTSLISYF